MQAMPSQAKTSLLDTLSPQLTALVEASLGRSLQEKPQNPSNESAVPVPFTVESCASVPTLSTERSLNPSEIFVLQHPESPGFIVRHNFLGTHDAMAVRKACMMLKDSGHLRDANVGVGNTPTIMHNPLVRGDQLMWLPPDDTDLPPAIQYLLRRVECLIHGIPYSRLVRGFHIDSFELGLARAAPALGIRNIRSTQFAVFVRIYRH
jgi:hypothetical protein